VDRRAGHTQPSEEDIAELTKAIRSAKACVLHNIQSYKPDVLVKDGCFYSIPDKEELNSLGQDSLPSLAYVPPFAKLES
jgi:hypothetical protein